MEMGNGIHINLGCTCVPKLKKTELLSKSFKLKTLQINSRLGQIGFKIAVRTGF